MGTAGQRRSAAVAVVLMFVLTASSYVGWGRIDQAMVVDGGISSSVKIDGYEADEFWSHCGMELINMNKAIEDLEECNPDEANCGIQNFDTEPIRKAIKFLHPNMKILLRDCFIRKNLQLVVSGDQYDTWYMKSLESIIPVSNVPRRYLASGIEPAASPGAPTAAPSSAPSPSPSPSPSPTPDAPPPISPAPLSVPSGTSNVPITPAGDGSLSSVPGSYKSISQKKSVAIAVGVTVPVTLLVAGLLILCYLKLCKGRSALRRNDKRPLLSVSLQELSDGPRQNSSFVPNSGNKDKRNGRVADNDVSPFAGDRYSHSYYAGEMNSQAYGFGSGGSSNAKFSAESHGISSSIVLPAPRPSSPPHANDASSRPHVESSRPARVDNRPSPPLPETGSVSVVPQTPAPPPPMIRPGTADSKPPGPPAPPKPPGPPAPPKPPGPTAPPKRPGPTAPPKPPGGPAGPPPLPPKPPSGPPPPPPRSGAAPPRPPPSATSGPRPPPGPGHSDGLVSESSAPKPKLKPFFWDKVLANPDSSMVWSQIKSGSFQFDEEMIESLFGSAPVDKNRKEHKSESAAKDPPIQYIKLIDQKKAQNISILLKALNLTTEEVCDALLEGYELPCELFQTLLKMAPTQEEELKLRSYDGDTTLLGPAERFLKALVEIPFAFQRIECLIFATSIQEEVSMTKQSFATLEEACKELRSSRLFLKLLEAVLKTGNRMNDGTFRGSAQAFKLDTLLKLSDVKGTDGKTTLLHFVVQEIIRSEGIKAARAAQGSSSSSSINYENSPEPIIDESDDHLKSLGLEVVSHLSSELEHVKKAAALDADSLTSSVAKLKTSLHKTRSFLDSNMKSISVESGFYQTIKNLVQNAEVDVLWLFEEEKRIMALVKSTGSYFHGNTGKDEGLHLFSVVRDFLIMVDKVCKELKNSQPKPARTTRAPSPSSDQTHQEPAAVVDMRQRLFPAIADRRAELHSSDDET